MIDTDREILYVTDPMCSWCWGFTPVIRKIIEHCGDRARLTVVAGGLRPGTVGPLPEGMRETILHHWHEVQRASGQAFNFDFNMGADFVYDTEPPCRALVTVRELNPDAALDYLHAMQTAFYVRNEDIVKTDVLARLAIDQGFDGAFIEAFNSPQMRQATADDFGRARTMGINGFPSVVLSHDGRKRLLTYGYLPFENLLPRLHNWLAE